MDMTLKVKLVPSNLSGFKSQVNKAGQTMTGGGGISGAIGGGLGGIGGMIGKVVAPLMAISAVLASSKTLQKEISRFMKSLFMVIRPIGDILAMFLRPITDVMRVVGKVVRALWRPMQKQINQQLRTGGQLLRSGDTAGAMGAYGSAFGMLFKPLGDLMYNVVKDAIFGRPQPPPETREGEAYTYPEVIIPPDVEDMITNGVTYPAIDLGFTPEDIIKYPAITTPDGAVISPLKAGTVTYPDIKLGTVKIPTKINIPKSIFTLPSEIWVDRSRFKLPSSIKIPSPEYDIPDSIAVPSSSFNFSDIEVPSWAFTFQPNSIPIQDPWGFSSMYGNQ